MRGGRILWLALGVMAMLLTALVWAASVQDPSSVPPAGGDLPQRSVVPPGPVADGPGDSFAESIEVTVVSVDVVVRDKAGQAVAGLTREDFALFEDGKPVEITNFSSPTVDRGSASARPSPATQPSPAGTAAAAPEVGKRERLNLVLYVDNANMRPFDRNRVLKQLRGFLQSNLGEGDQVLLITHDLGLHVRHPFREPLGSLGPELDQLDKESAGGTAAELATRQAMEQIRDILGSQSRRGGSGCGRVDEATGIARGYAESVLGGVKVTYANLHHLVESLGGLEGRKVLIYLGDGVPTQVGTDVYGMIEEKCPSVAGQAITQSMSVNTARLLHERSERINADRQDSLTSLARETGGRAAINGNDLRHDLAEIAADLGASYSLGFMPSHAGDGKTHALQVELKRPGLRAAYRQSYRDRSLAERLQGQVEAALIHGYGDNPLGASLKLGTATPAEHGRVLVPVQVRVPFGKLVYFPQEDGRHGRLTFLVGNIDDHGGMSPIQREQLPLRIPETEAKKVLASQLGHDFKLLLAPGRQRLAFILRDEVGRVSSCLIQDLDVDKKGTATLVAGAGAPASR